MRTFFGAEFMARPSTEGKKIFAIYFGLSSRSMQLKKKESYIGSFSFATGQTSGKQLVRSC
jgi:hypothetical protein